MSERGFTHVSIANSSAVAFGPGRARGLVEVHTGYALVAKVSRRAPHVERATLRVVPSSALGRHQDLWQLDVRLSYLFAMGKVVGTQMPEIVGDGEQRAIESNAGIASSLDSNFDSKGRLHIFGIAVDQDARCCFR